MRVCLLLLSWNKAELPTLCSLNMSQNVAGLEWKLGGIHRDAKMHVVSIHPIQFFCLDSVQIVKGFLSKWLPFVAIQ